MTTQQNNHHTILHLSLIPDIGPQVGQILLQRYGDNLDVLYTLTARDIESQTGLSRMRAEKIVAGLADKKMLDDELAYLSRHAIQMVFLGDAEYPPLLQEIHAPPLVLYYRGDLSVLHHTVALVGSRKADTYGQQVVKNLVPELVKEGFTTVSGGALGIDGMVHRQTIADKGATVAVLGSGLLEPYPSAHKGLFEDMVASGGVVMSSFPLRALPIPGNFPARNRIIAGLCRVTVVIQAARKSGALLTARNALDEGREVGAVPGSIFNEISAGCHDLLAQGARVITSADDVFDLLQHTSTTRSKKVTPERTFTPARQVLEDPVLRLCITPQCTDALLLQAGYSYDQLHERLWQLQIEGRLEQNMLGMWCAVE